MNSALTLLAPMKNWVSSRMEKETFNWRLTNHINERWSYNPNLFTDAELDTIINNSENPLLYTELESGLVGPKTSKLSVRDSQVSWIKCIKENAWLFERLTGVVLHNNEKFYNFDLTEIESLQFTKYPAGSGFYVNHIDMVHKSYGTRKLSFSVQLSDPSTYEGGDLLLHLDHEPTRMPRDRGTIIFFPSWTLHEVTPVTSGVRYSLVGWVEGPRFK